MDSIEDFVSKDEKIKELEKGMRSKDKEIASLKEKLHLERKKLIDEKLRQRRDITSLRRKVEKYERELIKINGITMRLINEN